MTRVKLCGVRNEEDLASVVRSGADAAGFLLGQLYPSDSFILPSTARRLAAALPPYISPVLTTHLSDSAAVLELIEKSGITTVQLLGCNLPETAKLRAALPQGKIIQTLYAARLAAFAELENFYPLVDAFDLDCYHASVETLESGEGVYDDAQTEDFLRRCLRPVLLSGHIGVERAAKLVLESHPYGIDSCADLRGESGAIDADKAAAFVRAVRFADYGIVENAPLL